MQNQMTPFDKAVHHYIPFIDELAVTESVLTQHYADKPWSFAQGHVDWQADSQPSMSEWNQHVQKAIEQEIQQQAKSYIESICEQKVKELSGGATEHQLMSWADNARRAKEFIANTLSAEEISVLQAECDARERQETPQILAQKQLDRAVNYSRKTAKLQGMKKAALDKVKLRVEPEHLNQVLHNLTEALKQPF